MTGERIEELKELLYKREIMQNEIEAFRKIHAIDPRKRGFEIVDTDAPRGTMVHFIKDHYGYIDEALKKIHAEIQRELTQINKEIDEF